MILAALRPAGRLSRSLIQTTGSILQLEEEEKNHRTRIFRGCLKWNTTSHSFSTATSTTDENKTVKEKKSPTTSSSSTVPVSLFKNPIVHQLWTARHEAKEKRKQLRGSSAATKQRRQQQQQQEKQSPASKTPEESRVQVIYNFSSNELLLEAYRSPWGQLRFGKLLEDLDALAGNIAFFHVDDDYWCGIMGNDDDDDNDEDANQHPLIVTASVDRIQFKQQPPVAGVDQVLSGQVTWTGRSSMEIRMHCQSVSEPEEWLEAFVTFVTLDPVTHKPAAQIPVLKPQTAEQRALFDAGAARAALRKKRRQQQKHATLLSPDLEQTALSLLNQAGPLLKMPSLADPHTILQSQTALQNALVAQPQVRNLHNRIFGGYLMRLAFELAFSNAYLFAGMRPTFVEVDEVSFTSPVDVGDLLVFHSRVLYTEESSSPESLSSPSSFSSSSPSAVLHIQVEAWVTEPEHTMAKIANQFHFTFQVNRAIRKVLPGNWEEARQMAWRMQVDQEQS